MKPPIFRLTNRNNNIANENCILSKADLLFKTSEIRTYSSNSSLHSEIVENLKSKKGVFFDANGVLYYRKATKIITLQNFLTSKGFDPSKFPKESELERVLKDLKLKAGKGQASKESFYAELFHLHGATDPSLVEEGVEEVKKSIAKVFVNKGVLKTLTSLRSNGYKLGVITNSMSSRCEKMGWLNSAGITVNWDGFVSSKEVGVKKPHPDIYLRCLEEAKVKPEEAVFVGHHLGELIGAKNLGFVTCKVNPDPDAVADIDLRHDLSNLLSYMYILLLRK